MVFVMVDCLFGTNILSFDNNFVFKNPSLRSNIKRDLGTRLFVFGFERLSHKARNLPFRDSFNDAVNFR